MSITPPISFNKSTVKISDISLDSIIEKLLLVLSEKERFIIENRFALKGKDKKTLEAIGKHYGVTRERIRQIERNGLKKLRRNAANTNLKIINELAWNITQKHGGLLAESKLIKILLHTLPNISEDQSNELKLSLSLEPKLIKTSNTLDFEPHWRTAAVDKETIRKISQAGYKILKEVKDVIEMATLTKRVQEKMKGKTHSDALMSSVMEIDKRMKFTKEGVGLKEWTHINPRTLRDKIKFILRKEQKPLHFKDIAKKIEEYEFDEKKTTIQAAHNELIRNPDLILVGRGVYALAEWGYKSGTVGDVIEEVLKDGKPRTREAIIKEVLKRRFVRKITIYLNIKSNPKIKSLEGDRYQLVK